MATAVNDRRAGRLTGSRAPRMLGPSSGRARLDRPGLVQYRTTTEYSPSHRPATRASRTKDEPLLCRARTRARQLDSNARNVSRVDRPADADVPLGGRRRNGAKRGACDARAAVAPSSPPLARLPPRPLPQTLYRSGKWFLSFPTGLSVWWNIPTVGAS